MAVKAAGANDSPEAQLRSSLARFAPKDQKLFRAVRSAVRKRLPTANELIYHYSNSAVIGYSPTERGIQAIIAITARADGVRVYFNQGPHLPDPKKLLMGTGKAARFIPVESARDLAHPDVKALFAAAVAHAGLPLAPKGRGKAIVRSAATKKRARRASAK